MSIIDSFDFIEKDERVRKYILPRRIARVSGNVSNAEGLLKNKTLQIGLNETDVTLLSNDGGERAYVVLDFGIELHGGIRILNFTSAKTAYPRVRLTFGESLSEAMSTLGHKGACNDHALRDFEISLPSYSDQEWGQTGFRFLKIELLDDNAEIAIKTAPAVFIYRELEYKGSLCCDDGELNRIFDTAAYTCHLNLQNMVWDGIKRDRLVWIGDMHPEMLTARTVFGPLGLINKSLKFARSQAPLPLYMNGMASYSMWWLIILWDYYFYSGDSSLLNSEKDYITALLEQFCQNVNDDGSDSVGNYFLDWPTHQKPVSEKGGVRALLKIALQKGALIADYYNDGRLSEECNNKARLLVKISGCHERQKQTAAFMAEAGMLSSDRAAEVIKDGQSNGISSYLLFYTLRELSKTDEISALHILKQYSGQMLEKGATTFWEDYDPAWADNAGTITDLPKEGQDDIHGDRGDYCYKGFRHSLCHGWASGAVPFLMEEIAGIHILDVGCKRVEIKPKMGNLKFINAAYPTPYGIIRLSVKNNNGRLEVSFTAPPEVEVVI